MKKMLLVEDHDLLLRAFLRQLDRYDVDVTYADSYTEALRHVMGTQRWDIILTDYDLSLTATKPGLEKCTGLLFLECTRNLQPHNKPIRALMSGAPLTLIERKERLQAATDVVLEKPFVMSEVADKLGLERRVDNG